MAPTSEYHLTHPPVMTTQMLIRKPAHEVFEAFADPAITTKLWFTKSTGRLEPDAKITWKWEMFDLKTTVWVQKFEQDKQIRIKWNEDNPTTVEWQFEPQGADATLVTITETGFAGDGDQVVKQAIGSMGGFSFLLASAKAFLEHGIVLRLVADHDPKKN